MIYEPQAGALYRSERKERLIIWELDFFTETGLRIDIREVAIIYVNK